MRQFIIGAFVLIGFISCRTQQEAVNGVSSTTEEQTKEVIPATDRLVGTVHLSDDACPVYIEAKMNNGKMASMYPVDLEDKYKVEGMQIRFTYTLSKVAQPEGCNAETTVTLQDVTRLR